MTPIVVGQQMLINVHHCDPRLTNAIPAAKELIHRIAQTLAVTILQEHYQQFEPYGITGFAIVSESHISVHTWPEYDYVAIDIFSCKPPIPQNVYKLLDDFFMGAPYDVQVFDRLADFSPRKEEA